MIKICDFGLAKNGATNPPTNIVKDATPHYLAPEVITNNAWSFRSDVFSFGMTIYEIFMENVPFADIEDVNAIKAQIVSESWKTSIRDNVKNEQAAKLIEWCCTKDIGTRPTINDVLQRIGEDIFCTRPYGMKYRICYIL